MSEGITLTFDEHEVLPSTAWSFLVRRRANHVCEECKKAAKTLHAHHMDGNSRNNCLANGIALCRVCQRKWDSKSRRVRKRETAKARKKREFAEAVASGELTIRRVDPATLR